MIKKFCDRCQIEMPINYINGESNITIQSLNKRDWKSQSNTLCPKCTEALNKFLEGDK